MLDVFKRISNRSAFFVTRRLLERKDLERIKLGETKIEPSLYTVAKIIYNTLLVNSGDVSKREYDEMSFFIENIETDEQFVVDYLKSIVWNYNTKVDTELDQFWKDYEKMMSAIK